MTGRRTGACVAALGRTRSSMGACRLCISNRVSVLSIVASGVALIGVSGICMSAGGTVAIAAVTIFRVFQAAIGMRSIGVVILGVAA